MQITALITYTPQKAPKGKKYGRPYVVLLSDQSTLLNTSLAKNCSWEYRERLERGSNADPAIDYDPLRLMSRSDAKLAPPKRFSARFGGL